MAIKTCLKCGGKFSHRSGGAYYCSKPCRFWSKVRVSDKASCWEWLGTKHGKHYGHFKMGSFVAKAHRIAYELTYGKIPSGLLVCHKCDNPSCCNPRHLWVGTNDDNLKDRQKKERQARGERSGRAKLSDKDVLAIRAQYWFKRNGSIDRSNSAELASRYGVRPKTITSIVAGRHWAHIK